MRSGAEWLSSSRECACSLSLGEAFSMTVTAAGCWPQDLGAGAGFAALGFGGLGFRV